MKFLVEVVMLMITGTHLLIPIGISIEDNIETEPLNPLWNITMKANVLSVKISGDGNYMVAGTGGSKLGLDNRIYLFNVSQGSTPIWTYQSSGGFRELSISRNGDFLVGGTEDGHICLFEKLSNETVWGYDTSEMITGLAMSSDGNWFAAGTGNWFGTGGKIYLFNRMSNTPLWEFQTGRHGADRWVEEVDISSDGEYIAAGAHDGVYVFNRIGNVLFHYNTTRWVLSSSMSSDGKYVVAGTGVGGTGISRVYFFDVSNRALAWSYSSPYGTIWAVDISSKGEYVVAGDMGAVDIVNSTVLLFNGWNGSLLWNFTTPTRQGPIRVSISHDDRFVAAGTAQGEIYYFYKGSNVPLWTYQVGYEIGCIDVSPNGNYTVAGTSGGLHQYLLLFFYDTSIFPSVIKATVDVNPTSLNLKSKGRWITFYIELPEGYNAGEIDVSTVTLNDAVQAELQPTEIGDHDNDGVPDLMVKFNRAEVIQTIISVINHSRFEKTMLVHNLVVKVARVIQNVELTVTGQLYDGTSFQGNKTTRILLPIKYASTS